MGIPLRVLVIEDSEDDTLLVIRALQKGGYEPTYERVDTASAMNDALNQQEWDIVISDHSMPHFNSFSALDVLQKRGVDLPFFLISGTIDEKMAVSAMKAGAHDYIMKGNLARLVSAVERELREAVVRREHKKAEEALSASEERYRTLFEGAAEGILVADIESKQFKYVNPAICRMLGYTMEELTRLGVADIHPKEALDHVVAEFEAQARGDKTWTTEIPCLRKDGNVIYASIATAPVIIEGRKCNVGFFMDITDQKLAGETLRQSEEKYRMLINNIPDITWTTDSEGHTIFISPYVTEVYGYTPEEIYADHELWLRRVHPDDIDRVMMAFKSLFIKNEKFDIEYRIQRKDGLWIWFHDRSFSVREKDGKRYADGVFADVTERKRAEQEMMNLQEQLRQSQKMEAIGQLAGGIAHDFNNLLTIIKGYSQLSLIELKEGDPLKGNIEEVKKATDRAADLIRQLLAFSRRQVMEMRVLDLNILFQNLDKMLRRVIGEDIELVTLLAEDLGRVKTDPGQIEQVILNLAVNARDAMPFGGKLTIETANVELDETYARRHVAVTPGRYVMLAVSDTGVGMTPEVRDRVFEPFFTTKEKGKGTGLGLSTVYGIVKQSEGNIWIYSEPGHGTTFKIYLPQAEELLEEVKEKVVGEELPCGSETVLVVEDEEEVRKVAARILRGQGYKVLEASNGADTLMICKEQKERFHLILTDVVMPQMSGRQLVEQLRQVYQNFKVLYMSGYTDNTIVHHGVLERGVNYIQKPFTMGDLAGKVREVLDNKDVSVKSPFAKGGKLFSDKL